MPSLGPAEILVILVIALLVFGPDKMPDIARQVGRGFREFRRVQNHLKAELRDVVSEFDSEANSAEERAKENTGTPVPTATGDPLPSLPPVEGVTDANSSNGVGTGGSSTSVPTSVPTSMPTEPAPAAAMPPAEVALPPAEVALPPVEVALPPVEVALPPAQPPADNA
ncbi:MAG: twin-arginine translocase TatA/TatE family subunit [Acidimicrobiia bacterium]